MGVVLGWLGVKGCFVWIAASRDDTLPELGMDIFQIYCREIELLGCDFASGSVAEAKEELSKAAIEFGHVSRNQMRES